MNNPTRREVLKWIAASASGMALLQSTRGLARALVSQEDPPALVWLNEGGDDLNLLTLLGQQVPSFLELVTLHWDLRSHSGLLPTGFPAIPSRSNFAPIIVAERLPAAEALAEALAEGSTSPLPGLLKRAKAAVLLGTDACFGGIVTSREDVAAFGEACRRWKTPLIKLPGVPVPPHHLVGVLAHMEYFGFPRLDRHGRPLVYYGSTVCSRCERRGALESGRFAGRFGESGCLLHLGCKGQIAYNSCSISRWNDGENWCVGAGGPCTACAEPGYPDHGGLGLYGALSGSVGGVRLPLWGSLEGFGYALLGLTGFGFFLQLLRRLFFPLPLDIPRGGERGEDS